MLLQSKKYIYGTDPTREVAQSMQEFAKQAEDMAAFNYKSDNPEDRALELCVRFISPTEIEETD